MTSLSQLSLLSTKTALGFDVIEDDKLQIQLSIDDRELSGVDWNSEELHFFYDEFCFKIFKETEPSIRLHLTVVTEKHSEWHLMGQLRLKVGDEEVGLKVVDRMVIEFFRFVKPLVIDVDSDVRILRIEFRIMNQEYRPHPSFDYGDIALRFGDGTILRTYRGLLALVSKYMASRVSDMSADCVEIDNFSANAFKELLLQLYPTGRPLFGDFRALAKASLAFNCDQLHYQLSKHVVEYKAKPMTTLEKLRLAMEMELHLAIEELVYRAAANGEWQLMLKDGFEPAQFFTPRVYREIVCPAVIAGKNQQPSMFLNPFQAPNFLSSSGRHNPFNVTILFRGTPFYVNHGIIAVHGLSRFIPQQDGSYVAKYTRDMQNACKVDGVVPGKVISALFTWLYPGAPKYLDAPMLRSAIVFCHDHEWNLAKEFLEQQLLDEPAINKIHYYEQFVFAERYGLKNMLRTLIFRAENSCNSFATDLISTPEFATLSEKTRFLITERSCGGWSIDPRFVTRIGVREPTSFRHRIAGMSRGGAVNPGGNEETLGELDSSYLYGEIEVLEL